MSLPLLIYQMFFPLVGLGILISIVFSGRVRALREGTGELRQRLGLIPETTASGLHEGGRRLLWVHAASVGEVMAAAPLLKEISTRENAPRILVTTTTVAGRNKALSVAAADAAFLAPMDFYPAIRAFLSRVRPDALVLVETELWPMTLKMVGDSGIAMGLANGRMRERTFGRYSMLSSLFQMLLAPFRRVAVQNEEAAERFIELGVNRGTVSVTGNIKYDQRAPSEPSVTESRARLESLGWANSPIWVAGSTRRGEEEILLDAHKAAATNINGLRLILVPRHPERVREVEKILRESGTRFVRWSEPLSAEINPDCLLIDELGVLANLYACATVAFVGGTLVPIGGHNILEPAVSGVPVLFGPHTATVEEVAKGLLDSGGGLKVFDSASVATALEAWIPDGPARDKALDGAKTVASRFNGATERTLKHLSPVLFGN